MIRKKYNKIIAVLVATFVIGSTFVGCTNKSASAETTTTSVSAEQTKNTTILGKVKVIDGSKITISLGEEVTTSASETTNGNTQNTQGQTSTPPAKPDGEAQTNGDAQTSQQGGGTTDGTPPEMPQGGGTNNGTPPEMPQGGGAPGMGNTSTTSFKVSGEEKTIDITNEGIISVTKGSKILVGTLADITIGEILSISYDNTGNVSRIIVKSNNTTYTGGSQTGKISLTGAYSANGETKTSTNEKISASEAAVVEGKNSITLYDSTISGEKKNGVMLYQSMSGDSGVGTSYFNMTGGILSSAEGSMFFITNTDSEINLKGATLKNSTGILLNAAGTTRWGNQGSNGGNVTLNANSQTLEGIITCDKISTVVLKLTNKSSLKSTINSSNTAKSVTLSLDNDSTWTVTGTSYITALTDVDTTLSNIKDNGNTIYYDSSNSANSWLNGKTITLNGGGTLKPVQ